MLQGGVTAKVRQAPRERALWRVRQWACPGKGFWGRNISEMGRQPSQILRSQLLKK
jgi:hypothetical protein